jgi:hypothetical protein
MKVLQGAIHPNSTNFDRSLKFNAVARMRKMVSTGLYKRPAWLDVVERAPPTELMNMRIQNRTLKNPYTKLISALLAKYPDMRFQDCFVDGNDWSKGNDTYRDDHPVMQFVARQLELINGGMPKSIAFKKTEGEFYERRKKLEIQQKLEMAMAVNSNVIPAFGSSQMPNPLYPNAEAYARQTAAQLEILHLRHIQRRLRQARDAMINEERNYLKKPLLKRPTETEAEEERVGLMSAKSRVEPLNRAPESPPPPSIEQDFEYSGFIEEDERWT